MKRTLVFSAIMSIALAACETPTGNETTVGSTQNTTIANLQFTVDTTYIINNPADMVAQGSVMNAGPYTVATGWLIECQFYTDASRRIKLGGNNTTIGVPLGPGQSTFWKIAFSSSNVDVRQYPNFSVGDLRGIYGN